MDIRIRGTTKEIADFILAIQNQQVFNELSDSMKVPCNVPLTVDLLNKEENKK